MIENFAAEGTKHIDEILIYKDLISADQWHELGADESLVGTMLHLLFALDQITIVVDSTPSAEIQPLIASVKQLLKEDITRHEFMAGTSSS